MLVCVVLVGANMQNWWILVQWHVFLHDTSHLRSCLSLGSVPLNQGQKATPHLSTITMFILLLSSLLWRLLPPPPCSGGRISGQNRNHLLLSCARLSPSNMSEFGRRHVCSAIRSCSMLLYVGFQLHIPPKMMITTNPMMMILTLWRFPMIVLRESK